MQRPPCVAKYGGTVFRTAALPDGPGPLSRVAAAMRHKLLQGWPKDKNV